MATSEVLRLAHDLVEAVEHEAGQDHVEEFVEQAVRNELERARARRFLDRLDQELGPVDEGMIERFDALFAEVEAAHSDV